MRGWCPFILDYCLCYINALGDNKITLRSFGHNKISLNNMANKSPWDNHILYGTSSDTPKCSQFPSIVTILDTGLSWLPTLHLKLCQACPNWWGKETPSSSNWSTTHFFDVEYEKQIMIHNSFPSLRMWEKSLSLFSSSINLQNLIYQIPLIRTSSWSHYFTKEKSF